MNRAAIIGICGYSGSGKTTLIEQLLLELQRKNFTVAVIKHHQQPVQNDTPGKDSYLPKLRLLRPDDHQSPPSISNILAVLSWSQNRLNLALPIIHQRLKNFPPASPHPRQPQSHQSVNRNLTLEITA